MPVTDPVMAVLDKLPSDVLQDTATEAAEPDHVVPSPFGLRFAWSPWSPATSTRRPTTR